MKRILTAILCAGVIAVSAAGCGYNDALYNNNNNNSSSSSQTSEESSNTEEKVSDAKYDNNLDGLIDYFDAKEYIENKEGSFVKMDASAIGAKEGKKFAIKYESSNLIIELYEYDTKSLNDTAKKTIKSVEDNGTFSVYGLPDVTAYLSDNGKYLMVYTDSSIDKENPDKTKSNYKHREEVIKDFKAFKK